jgi:hypothetical protein
MPTETKLVVTRGGLADVADRSAADKAAPLRGTAPGVVAGLAVGRHAHRTPGHMPAEDSKIKTADSSHPLIQHSAVFLGYRLSSSRPPRQGRPSGPSLGDGYATLDPATTRKGFAPTRKKGRKQGSGLKVPLAEVVGPSKQLTGPLAAEPAYQPGADRLAARIAFTRSCSRACCTLYASIARAFRALVKELVRNLPASSGSPLPRMTDIASPRPRLTTSNLSTSDQGTHWSGRLPERTRTPLSPTPIPSREGNRCPMALKTAPAAMAPTPPHAPVRARNAVTGSITLPRYQSRTSSPSESLISAIVTRAVGSRNAS